METKDFISAEEFCNHYQIEVSFIQTLYDLGLVNLNKEEDNLYISFDDFASLQMFINLHYNLQINPAGIDAIANLLDKIKIQQIEILSLQNKLNIYEEVANF